MSSIAIKDGILCPNTFNLSTGNGSLELWNKGNIVSTVNNNTIYKTIYSPSPINFVEPKTAAFSGCTTTGGSTRDPGQFNIIGQFNKGWNFYCLPDKTGTTVFMYALGNCSSEGAKGYYGLYGVYCTANPNGEERAYIWYFDSGWIYPNDLGNLRNIGGNIHPCLE